MSSHLHRTAIAETSAQASRTRLLIAVPFYKNERLVDRVAKSLLDCVDDLIDLQAEVVFFDDSPEYPPLRAALNEALSRIGDAFPVKLRANPANLGFVRTMNAAFADAAARGLDLLLLNSDTVVTPGALPEMVAVAATDPMIAAVCPRSNNATLCTFPWAERVPTMGPKEAEAAHRRLARHLPRVSYAPTAVGFCMLVMRKAIAEFGDFDERYGAGYNEENDFVMRFNRCGYRAVLANHAFVWHEGEQSFSVSDVPRHVQDQRNAAILDATYPEFRRLVTEHFASAQHQAERLITQLLGDASGRLDIAFDLCGFGPFHNGTHEAGTQLLAQAARAWSERFTLSVLCTPEVWRFHGLEDLPGIRRCDPNGGSLHAVVVRIGQPFDHESVARVFPRAPVQVLFMLDTIALDCGYLASESLGAAWSFALRRCDVLATNSAFSLAQFERRFAIPERIIRAPTLHSLDLAEYRRTPPGPAVTEPGYVFVVGNHFAHKHLGPTVKAILAERPTARVVALGATTAQDARERQIEWAQGHAPERLIVLPAGELDPGEMASLYAHAGVVVFPSHYEGFGFPILHGLAHEKPVFARALPVFEEIRARAPGGENVHLFDTTKELIAALRAQPGWRRTDSRPQPSGWDRSARELREAIELAIDRVDHARLLARLEDVRLIAPAVGPSAPPAPAPSPTPEPVWLSDADLAARFTADRIEWLLRRVYRAPMVLIAARAIRRAVRPGWRALRAAYARLRQ